MDSWEKINAVQRMQDYIDEHITDPISLHMLAKAAGYSPWHSARIFKELTGKTPFAYIRELRLSRAAIKLRDDNVKIIDVALDFVFDSHEGFTRAFSKQFGMTPQDYCKNKPPLKLFMPRRICDYYLMLQKGVNKMTKNNNTNTVFVQVIERPARKLILKRGVKATHYFEYCEEVGCDVWSMLCSIKEAIYEPIGMWLPENLRKPGTSIYAQGVEVPEDYSGEVPEGFEIIDLPPCKMMVFQGQPYEDDKFQEAIGDLWEAMKNYNPEIYGFRWADEDGPRFQLAPMGYRGYIEARPVRQLNTKSGT
ncbi:AraC family transcriptional regulator [Clostridium thermosuccinogenes]|uniref:AraC family transcriptional regulator n=1 Tax=Clostridium thermosuccinogenes TaxID=84032 RepID=A0A2K2FKX8_9CLOT|nr:AraC family transcriptional regulator [Pseudoclostridium thermosuccinogenes]AUS96042.1 AraC family transcriptional regulator [Pseudoclostridium thermosuccinogenes]PNT99430.1 AraC family transcriptional regulator [Pseudoclostridium thermosuccinogenes]PNU01117.1 AraC family transcriptional regulator [Pseudoclostridium thermosuccinogenes]